MTGGSGQKKSVMLLIILVALLLAKLAFIVFVLLSIIFLIIKFPTSNYGVGTCPYSYSSFGLFAMESQSPILYNLSEIIMKVIYSVNSDGKAVGVLSNYRNSLLLNDGFQIIRILLAILVTALLGLGFVFGFINMKSSDMLKRFGILILFLWATDSATYSFYDLLIEPLILNGYKGLSYIINYSLASTIEIAELAQYIKDHSYNEFGFMDAVLTSIFSKAIFTKLISLSMINVPELSSPLVLITGAISTVFVYFVGIYLAYIFMRFVIEMTFYKVLIVVGLSLFPLFILFFATKVVGGSIDKFSSFFSKYLIELIIKPSFTLVVMIFASSLISVFIMQYLFGALSFEVCVNIRYTGFLGTFYNFQPSAPANTTELIGTFLFLDETKYPNSSNWERLLTMFFPNIFMVCVMTILFKSSMPKIKEIMYAIVPGVTSDNAFSNMISSAAQFLQSTKIGQKLDSVMQKQNSDIRRAISPSNVVNSAAALLLPKYFSNRKPSNDNPKNGNNEKTDDLKNLDKKSSIGKEKPKNPSIEDAKLTQNSTDKTPKVDNLSQDKENVDNETPVNKVDDTSSPINTSSSTNKNEENSSELNVNANGTTLANNDDINTNADNSYNSPQEAKTLDTPNRDESGQIHSNDKILSNDNNNTSKNKVDDTSSSTNKNEENSSELNVNVNDTTLANNDNTLLPYDIDTNADNSYNSLQEAKTLDTLNPDEFGQIHSNDKILSDDNNNTSKNKVDDTSSHQKNIDENVIKPPILQNEIPEANNSSKLEGKQYIAQDPKPIKVKERSIKNNDVKIVNPIYSDNFNSIRNDLNQIDNKLNEIFETNLNDLFGENTPKTTENNTNTLDKVEETYKKVKEKVELMEKIKNIGNIESESESETPSYNSATKVPKNISSKIGNFGTASSKPQKDFIEFNKANVNQNAQKNSSSLQKPKNKK
jgi:hypothetical protein